jgi:hypothetical protein
LLAAVLAVPAVLLEMLVELVVVRVVLELELVYL